MSRNFGRLIGAARGTTAPAILTILSAVGCAGTSAGGDDPESRRLHAEINSQRERLAEQRAQLQSMSRSLEDISKRLGSSPSSAPAPAAERSVGGEWKPGASSGAAAAPAGTSVASGAPGVSDPPAPVGSSVSAQASVSGAAVTVPAGTAAGAGSAAPPAAGDKPAAEPDLVVGQDRFRDQVSATLKELLKDPEFAKQFQKSGGPQFGYRKDVDFQNSGFFLEDPGSFRLNLEGWAQVRYTYANYLDKNSRNGVIRSAGVGTAGDEQTNFDTRSDFNIPRMRLSFTGYAFTPDIKYHLELNASSSNRAGGDGGGGGIGDIAQIQKAYVDWNVLGSNNDVPPFWRQALQIRFGEDYMPGAIRTQVINHWGSQGSADTQLVDWNIVQQNFLEDRAVGLQVHGVLGGVREGLPADRPGTAGFFEYIFAVHNGISSAGQRYGIDAGGAGTAGRGLDKYPALGFRGNFDILKGKYTGLDGRDYYWFGRNQSDLENHETPAWQAGGGIAWQRMRDQNSPSNNSVLGDFYNPTQQVERLPVYNSKNQIIGYANGSTLPYDKYGSDIVRIGADTAFKWKGFSLTAEFAYQHIEANSPGGTTSLSTSNPTNGTTGAFPVNSATQNQDNFAWYVQGGYFIVPRKWELFGAVAGIHAPSRPRSDRLTVVPNNPTQNQIIAAEAAAAAAHAAGTDGSENGDTYQFTFGTNWFPFESRKMKVSLDATYLVNPAFNNATQNYVQRGGENNWLLRAQVQFGF